MLKENRRKIEMGLISEKDRDFLRKKFEEELIEDVKFVFFTQREGAIIMPSGECPYCKTTHELLDELTSLSPKLQLEIHDFLEEEELAKKLGIDKIPALTIQRPEKDYGVRFFGIPSGYEFSSVLEDIIDVSRGETSLSKDTKEKLAQINKNVRIQVFVTPTCPYCPKAVRMAHMMAIESDYVVGEMVEAIEFPHLSERYGVEGVPKIVINDTVEFVGAYPEEAYLEYVLKAVEI